MFEYENFLNEMCSIIILDEVVDFRRSARFVIPYQDDVIRSVILTHSRMVF